MLGPKRCFLAWENQPCRVLIIALLIVLMGLQAVVASEVVWGGACSKGWEYWCFRDKPSSMQCFQAKSCHQNIVCWQCNLTLRLAALHRVAWVERMSVRCQSLPQQLQCLEPSHLGHGQVHVLSNAGLLTSILCGYCLLSTAADCFAGK